MITALAEPAPLPCGCAGDQLCAQHLQALSRAQIAELRRRGRGVRGKGRGRPSLTTPPSPKDAA